jgi:hypothetical protein
MTDPIADAEVHDYLARYAASLTGLDADAAAALWSAPGMIVDDRYSGVLGSREEMADGLRSSYPLYQRLGLASVGYELLRTERLTDAIVLAGVRWLFRDSEGDPLTDSTGYYVLRREAEGLLACVCVQTDDREKLAALAAERGVDLG